MTWQNIPLIYILVNIARAYIEMQVSAKFDLTVP